MPVTVKNVVIGDAMPGKLQNFASKSVGIAASKSVGIAAPMFRLKNKLLCLLGTLFDHEDGSSMFF
jgi:hypothetical protein